MSDIGKRISAAMLSFTKIGTQNGSAPPHVADNRVGLAYELLVAQRLKSAAEARVEAAKAAALAAGLIAEEYSPGDHTPFTSTTLNINVKRNKDGTMLDGQKLMNELVKKLGETDAKKLVMSASKPRKGNTIISVSMVG